MPLVKITMPGAFGSSWVFDEIVMAEGFSLGLNVLGAMGMLVNVEDGLEFLIRVSSATPLEVAEREVRTARALLLVA